MKGLKGYKKTLLDELDHFAYEDYKELKRRLSGEDGQQIIYTWNPVSIEHWVKKKVIDSETWIETSKEIENLRNFLWYIKYRISYLYFYWNLFS